MHSSGKLSRIKMKALLLGVVPAALLGVALSFYVIASQLEDLDKLFNEGGNSIAREVAAVCAANLSSDNSIGLLRDLEQILQRRDVVSISIKDPEQRTISSVQAPSFSSQSVTEPTDYRTFKAPVFSNAAFSVSAPNSNNEESIGTAYIVLSTKRLNELELEAYRSSLLFLLLGLAITAVVALFMSRTITQPISKLTDAVLGMKNGDLSSKVPETSTGELRSLEEGFNAMSEELQRAQGTLQSQVEQATADLMETIEAIEIQNVELDLAKKRAIAADSAKTKILDTIGLKIQSPLKNILGLTKTLKQSEMSENQSEYVSKIDDSTSGVLKLMNEIVDFSNLEEGKTEIQTAPFNVTDCFESAIEGLVPAALIRNTELVLMIYSDVPNTLVGDEHRITQMITSIVESGLNYTDHGEIVIRVMLDDDNDQECQLVFTVSDSGSGLSDSACESLISSRNTPLSGSSITHEGIELGLTICRRLAHAMEGQFDVESSQGKGTTYKVTLKLPKITEISVNHIPHLDGFRATIYDSSVPSSNAIKHCLNMANIESKSYSLDQLLSAKEQTDIALISLSVNELKNIATLKMVEKYIANRSKPTLILASTLDLSQLTRFTKKDAVECLSKPLRRRALLEALESSLSIHEEVRRKTTSDGRLPTLEGVSILVADDNKINLKLLETMLIQKNATVYSAANGLEALDIFNEYSIDLVIMDVHMPVMDGKELVSAIRRGSKRNNLPIVAVTADLVNQQKNDLLKSGVNAYLTKPISKSSLWRTLNKYLGTTDADTYDSDQPIEKALSPSTETTYLRDLGIALDAAGGNRELADRMFTQFLGELNMYIDKIRKLSDQKDWATLSDTLHQMRGGSSVCGTTALTELLASLETRIQENDLSTVHSDVDRLLEHCQQLLDSEHSSVVPA